MCVFFFLPTTDFHFSLRTCVFASDEDSALGNVKLPMFAYVQNEVLDIVLSRYTSASSAHTAAPRLRAYRLQTTVLS